MEPDEPLIIIGAPRSGTNILRDVVCRLDGFGTWPCDEINYIWRHGNIAEPTDEFSADQASPAVKAYIRGRFAGLSKKRNLRHVVEKTCANSLRVPFVDAIFPNARYLFIYRNGLDVVGSAILRWQARLDLPYLLRKARYVPPSDLPYYAAHYLGNRVYRLFSPDKRLAFWGPRFSGMESALASMSLEEVCALQWQRCVELADESFARMPPNRVFRLSYEDFVSNPSAVLERAFENLELDVEDDTLAAVGGQVSTSSIGKGSRSLSQQGRERVRALVGDTLASFGYA